MSLKRRERRAEEYDSERKRRKSTAAFPSFSANSAGDTQTDSEPLLVNFMEYRSTLDRIFFKDRDIIKRGSPEYDEFYSFLQKYQTFQQKKGQTNSTARNTNLSTTHLDLPKNYDKRYRINFSILSDEKDLITRMPVRDDDEKQIPMRVVTAFRDVLLIYLDFCQRRRFDKVRKLREAQANLPIAQYREQIIDVIRSNQVVIVAGDTGCGKSTQLPQYLLQAGFTNIACTQPRRLACIALSKRVAFETLNDYGSEVGYQIRFEKSKTQHTRILFLTEGLLLRQVTSDSMLSSYNVVVLDEVHERHLHGDFLLGVVKCLAYQRPDVKVILMSATINIDLFANYFNGAPVIQVPGRLYPIKVNHRPVSIEEKGTRINPAPYVRILQLIDQKYPKTERGDVLIFMSGMTEISAVVDACKQYGEKTLSWLILPLHSSLSLADQDKVFDIAPEGVRKCIVSTNIAETSLTIDGIRFVVDSGKAKEMNFDPATKMQKLQEFWISRASSEQRKGRAGRTGPGVCFRLYSEKEYADLADYATPEILRVPLDSLILQMISMGLPDARKFPFIEAPPVEAIENAITSLRDHGALTPDEALTPLGEMLSRLPVDVTIGKILVMGSLFCMDEQVLSLAAALSIQSPITNRGQRDPDAVAARKSFESGHGDPFTLLNCYVGWLKVKCDPHGHSKRWCRHRGLEEQRFYEMTKLRRQFKDLLLESKNMSIAKDEPQSSTERSQRHGEMRQLKDMKRQYHKTTRKRRVLRLGVDDAGEEAASDEEDKSGEIDIKDVEFRMSNTRGQVEELSIAASSFTHQDMVIAKMILCSGLYPQFALADEHNSYKSDADQLFHSKGKAYVVLHPLSVFASSPDYIELTDADIVNYPGFESKQVLSSRHQLLAFVSLLETFKPYVCNNARVPAINVLLLFSMNIDSNHDMSRLVFDQWLETRFPEPSVSQDMVMRAKEIRLLWQQTLKAKLAEIINKVDTKSKENVNRMRDLRTKILSFLNLEPLYTVRRLLAADLKEIYIGYSRTSDDMAASAPNWGEPVTTDTVKGGIKLTSYFTFNCLDDTVGAGQSFLEVTWTCPYCETTLRAPVLVKMQHESACRAATIEKDAQLVAQESDAKEFAAYFCDICAMDLYLSNMDILRHKRAHQSSN